MLVHDGQIDCLKQDRVIAVILVYMLSHLDLLEDAFDQCIDLSQKFLVSNRRGANLKDLEDLDLEPGARSHVVIVVCGILLNISQNGYKLGDQAHVLLIAKH